MKKIILFTLHCLLLALVIQQNLFMTMVINMYHGSWTPILN